MENNRAPQQPAHRPHRSNLAARTIQSTSRRPSVDGFTPRRWSPPTSSQSQPPRPTVSMPRLVQHVSPSVPQTAPRPVAAHATTQTTTPQVLVSNQPTVAAQHKLSDASATRSSSTNPKPPKETDRTGHVGLVGCAVFLLLGALLVSPFVPGKAIKDFPLSSQSFATGEQSLDCLGTQSKVTSTTGYTTKLGSPINWLYDTNTTQSASCSGTSQSAVIGHTSQFSLLALVLDLTSALVIAIVISRIWRFIFNRTHRTR